MTTKLPDMIRRELDAADDAKVPYQIKEAKDRNLVYVNGVFCGYIPRTSGDMRGSVLRNVSAMIKREVAKHSPTLTPKFKPHYAQEKKTMTQTDEFAALAGRLGRIEQMLVDAARVFEELVEEQKMVCQLVADANSGIELLLDAGKPAGAKLPIGWLQTAVKKLMADGELRHVFEVWKEIKKEYPDVSEASVGSTMAKLFDDGDLKRERMGVYYAEKA